MNRMDERKELTAEEKDAADKVLAGKKEEALEKINDLKSSVYYDNYTDDNWAKIDELYKTAKGLVEDALTAEEINAAVSAFETELNKIPQKEEKRGVLGEDKLRECTGCGVCESVCPFGAIKITENNEGFYTPVIDEAKCTDCGLCKKNCYKFDEAFRIKKQKLTSATVR